MRLALLLLVLAACKHEEQVGTISGPPLLIDRTAASAPPPIEDASAADAASPPPLVARFSMVDARAADVGAEIDDCVQTIFVGVSGSVVVGGTMKGTLGPGDAITLSGKSSYEVHGNGTLVLASVTAASCEPVAKSKLYRAAAVKPLTWAGGKMHATLLVEKDDAKFAYVGLLEGTAAVAKHGHERSCEVLFAIEAAGDFTLAGHRSRVAPKT